MKTPGVGILFSLLVILCGCAGEDPLDKVVFADSGRSFNLISGSGRSGSAVCEGVEYYVTFDDENKRATVTISNLRLEPDDAPMTFTFSNLDWEFGPSSHISQRVIDIPEVYPDNNGGESHTFTDFIMVYSQANEYDPHNSDGFYIHYRVDSRYEITAYPQTMLCQGTTRVVDIAAGSDQIDYNTLYRLTLSTEPELSADIAITSLPVYGRRIDVDIKSVRLGLFRRGYTLEYCAAHTSASSPAVPVRISGLTASADLLDRLVMEMELNVVGRDYRVYAYLSPNLNPR